MRASSQGEHAWSVAAGVGLGSLLGLRVGLSHSPVLATVLNPCHIGAKPRLTQHGETMGMSPPAASSTGIVCF
jgi:hypothetical protein